VNAINRSKIEILLDAWHRFENKTKKCIKLVEKVIEKRKKKRKKKIKKIDFKKKEKKLSN